MTAVIVKSGGGKKPFVTAPYILTNGSFDPGLVSCCPKAPSDTSKCDTAGKDWRDRLTGITFPLRILFCKSHGCFFTVYPLGWAPYQRSPVIVLAPDGKHIHGEDECENSSFDESGFAAALDLAEGKQWPPDLETADVYGVSDPPGVARTQFRHIVKLSRFFGISCGLDEKFIQKTAENLDIPAQKIIDSAARVRDGPFSKIKAAEMKGLLRSFATPSLTLRNLLEQGAHAGFWGTPLIRT